MQLTALGRSVVVFPDFLNSGHWFVVVCDKRGNWKCGQTVSSEIEARKARSKIFAHHRRVFRDRKRKAGG